MKAKTVTEVLKAARWIIENVGWCQKNFVEYDKDVKPIAFCAIGALDQVEIEDTSVSCNFYGKAKLLLTDSIPSQYNLIVDFNDSSYRTKEDILALYDKAIEKANGL